jgi:hypothetical protein
VPLAHLRDYRLLAGTQPLPPLLLQRLDLLREENYFLSLAL